MTLNLSPCGNLSCVFVKWKFVSIVPLPLTENMFIMVSLEAGHFGILCQNHGLICPHLTDPGFPWTKSILFVFVCLLFIDYRLTNIHKIMPSLQENNNVQHHCATFVKVFFTLLLMSINM